MVVFMWIQSGSQLGVSVRRLCLHNSCLFLSIVLLLREFLLSVVLLLLHEFLSLFVVLLLLDELLFLCVVLLLLHEFLFLSVVLLLLHGFLFLVLLLLREFLLSVVLLLLHEFLSLFVVLLLHDELHKRHRNRMTDFHYCIFLHCATPVAINIRASMGVDAIVVRRVSYFRRTIFCVRTRGAVSTTITFVLPHPFKC